MDRFPAPMPRSLRFSAALLIASAVVGCQGDTPAAPAQPEPQFDLTLDGARIDLSIFDQAALGDIGRLIGVETATGGALRGLGDPPILAAPVAPGELPSVTPLETTVVLYVVTLWLFENGFLDAPSAVSASLPVVGAYSWLLVGEEQNAVDSFNEFIQVVQGLVDDGLLDPVAGQWLIDCAQAAIDQLFDCSAVATIPTGECEALVALYHSTDGDNWNNNAGWLLSADPCTWFGVGCSGGQVTGISLSFNNLTGPIPAELGNLTSLTGLSLDFNQLSGPIPAELGNLTSLTSLGLKSNNLTGSIPAELGNLTYLTRLFLDFNQLSGPIPAELGNLAALHSLRLDFNQLSGLVPLPVAVLGGAIQEIFVVGTCRFESNPGLFMPDSQDYMDADLDNDGFICGVALSTPSP